MLRRAGGLLFLGILAMSIAFSPIAGAIETNPSTPTKIDGPLQIVGYSFSGHTLRYLQFYNSSSGIVALDGWKVSTSWNTGAFEYDQLSGIMAPKTKATFADSSLVPTATFSYTPIEASSEPRLATLSLIPPSQTNWIDHVVTITINDSSGSSRTPRENSAPETFYFARNISSSTGNYLSSFSAFLPTSDLVLESDPLYEIPLQSPLRIVELYPHGIACAPNESSLLCQDYVKIQNTSPYSVDLAKFRLRVGSAGQTSTSSNTAYMTGNLAPNAYVAFPLTLTDSGSWVWVEDLYGSAQYAETIVQYPSVSGRDGWAWSFNSQADVWQWTHYPTPSNEENLFAQIGTVNQCTGVRLSEIAANTSNQFIEVYNPTNAISDISGCQILTNRSQTASFTFAEGTKLEPGAYRVVSVADTPLSLTKTTSGTVYLVSSDGSTEVDARYYENLDENTSLALVGGTWVQTFTITPETENQYSQYPPCDSGYIRNPETGRCNKIQTVATLKPCLPTQYRSPETNRCRNLVSATSSLTPCKVGQYRNPETNRCRSLASTTSTLKPCAPNQERNPLTNRCRNVVKTVNADFPVEAVAGASQASVGWWAFGGVGLLAAGYAGWEWRHELLGLLRKTAFFIPSGK